MGCVYVLVLKFYIILFPFNITAMPIAIKMISKEEIRIIYYQIH